MAKVHLEGRRCQHEQLEWKRRWQHGGKHQRPELVPVEGPTNFLKALLRHPFFQQHLSALVSDQVEHNAARGRARRRHDHVQQEPGMILVDITGHHRIDRHSKKRGINRSNREYTPSTQRLEQRPDEGGVARQNVPEASQGRKILRESSRPAPQLGA